MTQTLLLSRCAETYIILLTTPIDQCLADIRARRERAGNVRPLSEKNTRAREPALLRAFDRLRYAQAPNIKAWKLDREAAFENCVNILGVQVCPC